MRSLLSRSRETARGSKTVALLPRWRFESIAADIVAATAALADKLSTLGTLKLLKRKNPIHYTNTSFHSNLRKL